MAPPWSILLLVALVGAQNTQEGATRALPMISNVACTKQMGCPDEYSCVMTPGDGSACCPLAQGTACQDGRHCCPLGTHCSEDGHSCLPASNLSAIICPDGASECPSGSTCCQMPSGSWGCCPLEQATCCNDHVHCCPHNTKCDLVHGTCNLHNEVFPMSKKVPARMKLQSSAKVLRTQCNDGSSCPDGSTCCQLGDKTFGCCPLMSAVCCGDHLHCCPSGTSCDIPHKKCTSKDSETPMVEKIPALREEATVRCNATAVCPGSTTCCRLSSGDWGCCPFEKAVCCADKVHCCPSGFTCTGSGCAKDQDSIPWLEKMPALKEEGNNVPCDPTSFCPDKTTCCRLPSGQWGCCPIEKAVCCSDHEHCCPSGYTCDVLSQTCNKPTDEPSLAIAPVGYVWCDNAHYCYDGQTCCRGPYGWACCPYTQGVCCPDRVHCCPYGHICLNQGAQCSQSDTPQWDLGWLKKKLPAKMFP